MANALLGLASEANVAAQLASRNASISALQSSKADASLLLSYATNAALSASETALQSALDAIIADLAALQLSSGRGVDNAPAWTGFTTWELVRGSNVIRNLHLEAPLSAALANGDDTLSIAASARESSVWAAGPRRRFSTTAPSAPVRARAPPSATSVICCRCLAQLAILLRRGQFFLVGRAFFFHLQVWPGAFYTVFAWRDCCIALLDAWHVPPKPRNAVADCRTATAQNGETASAIAAALTAHHTAAQVDALLTDCRTASAQDTQTQAAIAGRTCSRPTKSPRRWCRTARPPTRTRRRPRASPPPCSATTPSCRWTASLLLLFACRYRLGTASNFVVNMSEADNVDDPLCGSFVGDQGA